MSSREITISPTKIIIPSLRPEILRRRRLLEHFDDLLEKKLIIVTAPAGYGKTSLLVDFSHQSEMPVCWLSLDPLDKDPQRFITYLIAALAEQFPHFGKRTKAVLSTITSFEHDSERLLSSLINETNDQIKEHYSLILDDYHLVDSIPTIRDLFSRFVSLVGENCHVILASRRLPTLVDITLMVARQQVGGFDLEELAFRPDEIRALFEQNHGVKLTSGAAEELVRQTEGWIIGLHLSADETIRALADPMTSRANARKKQALRATGVDLSVYFDQQVVTLQSPELRNFLLQTSLLEEFDAGLCEAVLGAGNWKNLLTEVKRNNLFVLPVGPHGKWMRYHALFKEYLQERIYQESPAQAGAILTRLAEVCEERGEWERAHALVRQLGKMDALAGLLERVGTSMLVSGRLITLQSWLDDLPVVLWQNRPVLQSLKGALLCGLGDGTGALPLLDRAIVMFQEMQDSPGLPLAFVRRAAARRLVGDYAGALEDAEDALRFSNIAPGQQTAIAEALRFKGISLFRLGQSEAAFASLVDSLRRYELLGEAESIARLQMDLGWICQATGKYAEAARYYQKTMLAWKRENNLYFQASTLNNLAVLYYMQGEYEPAVKNLEEGLACARLGNFRTQEALLLTSLGDVLSDLDEYESARQTYAVAGEIAGQVSYQFLVNYLFLVQVRLARLQGRFQEAYAGLQKVRPLVETAGSNYELGLLHLESGCLYLAEAQPQQALADLHKALDQFRRGNLLAETEWAHAWLAANLIFCGEDAAAQEHLQVVLAALPQESRDPPLVHMLRHAVPWLTKATSNAVVNLLMDRVNLAGKRMLGLRKRLRRMLKAAPLQTSRLSIQVLGKPQVRLNGKLVTLSQWGTVSVRDLFFFFLLSTHPVTKEEVGQVFWPELEPDRFKLRFKNNLYRLRHALGQDVILFENNQYFFNRHLDFEYDVEEFDASLAQSRIVQRVEDKIVHLLAATKQWHGTPFQGLDAVWAVTEQKHLERAYLDALKQLADLQHQAGNWDSALQACQRALEVDACLEEFHQLAMRLHAERRDRLAIIWQYQACCNALRTELEIDPSEETRVLYQRLTS